MKLLPALAAALAISLAASADDLDAKLQNIQKVGEEFAAASAMGSANDSLRLLAGEYREFSSNFSSLQSYVQDGNYDQAVRILQRWLARTKNEQVKSALNELLAALKKEKQARDDKMAAKVDELLKGASKDLASASTPEQVAAIQIRIEEFRDYELNTGDRANRILSDRLNRAVNFLNSWQQVVASEASGDWASALQSLNNIRRTAYGSPLLDSGVLSRKYDALMTAVLARDTSAKDSSPIHRLIAKTMAEVKEPSSAAEAAAVMGDICSICSGNESRLANSLQNALSEIARMSGDLQAGAYARVVGSTGGTSGCGAYSAQLEALRDSLRAKAVAAANDLPDLGSPKPGEGFATFIRRQAVEAHTKKDWQRLYTLLAVYSSSTGGGCARTFDMKEGVESYLAAQQLEEAGQFGDAVSAYSKCVAQLGKLVPREEASAALARLRKEHPEAFSPVGGRAGAF